MTWSDYKREKNVTASEEFAELEAVGFETDRIYIKSGVVFPFFKAQYLLDSGFLPKGSKVRYLDENGNDWDRQYARKRGLVKDQVFTVVKTKIGDWSSEYTFEEVEGTYNTVMFSA